MADTGGIAALLKALNDSPGLGGGLKPTPAVQRSSEFAATAGIVKPASTATTTAAAAPARPVRSASNAYGGSKPKVLIADGMTYSPRAPRGTYLDMLV